MRGPWSDAKTNLTGDAPADPGTKSRQPRPLLTLRKQVAGQPTYFMELASLLPLRARESLFPSIPGIACLFVFEIYPSRLIVFCWSFSLLCIVAASVPPPLPIPSSRPSPAQPANGSTPQTANGKDCDSFIPNKPTPDFLCAKSVITGTFFTLFSASRIRI